MVTQALSSSRHLHMSMARVSRVSFLKAKPNTVIFLPKMVLEHSINQVPHKTLLLEVVDLYN